MQEGIITKIESKFIIIKTDDSDIERIKIRPQVKVGDRITYSKKDVYHGFNRLSYKQLGTSLSLLIMLAIVSGVLFNNLTNSRVYGVVSFDVNPSIQVEINKKNQVLNITQNTYQEIIPDNYESMPLDEFLTLLIENSKSNNLLKDNETVLITYTPINHDNNQNQVLNNFVTTQKNYNIILITKDQAYLDKATENSMSVGRYFLYEQLDKLDIELEESNAFIQDAYEIINTLKPETFDSSELNTEEDIIIEETETAEVIDTEEQTAEEEKTDDQTAEDKRTEEEKAEEEAAIKKAEEELKAKEEAEMQAKILAQETVVNTSYNAYLSRKSDVDEWQRKQNDKEAEIKTQEDILISQKSKYQSNLEGTKVLQEEEKILINNIEVVKVNELETAKKDKDNTIASYDSDKVARDQLKSEANVIYAEAANEIFDDQTLAKEELNTIKTSYQEDINRLQNSATADHSQEITNLEAEIENIDQMIQTIDGLSGPIDQTQYDFIYNYNIAYDTYQKSILLADDKIREADAYQNKIDKGIEQAESDYKTAVATIEDKYVSDEKRIKEITNILAGVHEVNLKFVDSIESIEVLIINLKSELEQIQASYNDAKKKETFAYNQYLEEKKVLDQLKGQ